MLDTRGCFSTESDLYLLKLGFLGWELSISACSRLVESEGEWLGLVNGCAGLSEQMSPGDDVTAWKGGCNEGNDGGPLSQVAVNPSSSF